MTDTKLLNKHIQSSGLKKVFIAEKLGMTPAGLHKCLTGKSEFKVSHMYILCDLLRITDHKTRDAIFFADSVAFKATHKGGAA